MYLLTQHVLHKVCHLGVLSLVCNIMQLPQLVKVELLQGQCQLHCMQCIAFLLILIVCLGSCQMCQLGTPATNSLYTLCKLRAIPITLQGVHVHDQYSQCPPHNIKCVSGHQVISAKSIAGLDPYFRLTIIRHMDRTRISVSISSSRHLLAIPHN